jgi:prepilin-type N-terminal cleavage/methylation domain-containing protein
VDETPAAHRTHPEETMRRQAGFTLIELMIVVVIIGVLAAVAIPNFISMQGRAKEGSTKANMHTFQISAEDFAVMHDGVYATDALSVLPHLPGGEALFVNPFAHGIGVGVAWEDRASYAAGPTATPGLTSYSDSLTGTYNVKGYGQATTLPLVLTSGY